MPVWEGSPTTIQGVKVSSKETLGDCKFICVCTSEASFSRRNEIHGDLHRRLLKVRLGLLKEKFEVFLKFKKFKEKVEREVDHKIHCLCTDNGGEFTSEEFSKYLKEHGI